MGLIDRDGEKGVFLINSCMSGTRGCVSYISLQWLHLESGYIYDNPLLFSNIQQFLYRPKRQVEWGCGGNYHPASLNSLMLAIISNPSNNLVLCFWFTILLDRRNSSSFYLTFPTIMALTPWVREPACYNSGSGQVKCLS